ncbi:MAG: protein kinase [Terriglobia bacterium]
MRSCPECSATFPDDYALCPKDGAPLRETTLWQIGTVVRGKYHILARLGEGGMAVVYKAQHVLLDELRALKVIRPDLARDNEFMGRFRNEAIMARKLNHPNAVRVDDLDIAEDGLPFIAMELVVGDTLKTLVQRAGALPVSLVLNVSAQVCEALDAAHKLGLIHRDIKPDNIVLIAQDNGFPVAKILDFGISRLREETAGMKGLTQTGMVIGTPEYMSPEQVLGKQRVEIDGRSDLYSLGIVMYRMLTGELPFQAETTVEMIMEQLNTPPIPPHKLKPELAIPEAVSAIVMRALEKDREKRYSTGASMAAAIKRARAATTPPSRKMKWEAASSPAASSDAEIAPPSSPATDEGDATSRPTASEDIAPPTPTGERVLYRSSARIGPPPKEFPTRWVLALVAVAVLAGGAFAVRKRIPAWRSAVQARITAFMAPAKATENTPSSAEKTAATPNGQRLASRQGLSYEEKAKIIELNSLAAYYYREGGCEKALSTYQKVLEIDPGDPRAYAAVEKCYAKARNGVSIAPPTTPDSPNP